MGTILEYPLQAVEKRDNLKIAESLDKSAEIPFIAIALSIHRFVVRCLVPLSLVIAKRIERWRDRTSKDAKFFPVLF